ncbi:MAG TPA: hypothetical protein VKM56_13300 [Verrucomicrobiae bacterium]|nr:hypothetical protein [Verrucomicrobiae bacterium]
MRLAVGKSIRAKFLGRNGTGSGLASTIDDLITGVLVFPDKLGHLGTFNTVENTITLYKGSNLGTVSEELLHWNQVQEAGWLGRPISKAAVPALEREVSAILQEWGFLKK